MQEKLSNIREKIQTQKNEIILFYIFFAVNAVIALNMKYPIITDEYVTLAEGAFLWGNKTLGESFRTLTSTGYYGWGFSVLFGWVYRIWPNLFVLYHAALIYNSVLIGMIPVIVYKLANQFFEISVRRSVLISIIIACCPAYIIYSKYALNEVPLFFSVWLIIYLFYKYENAQIKPKYIYAGLIALSSMYTYTLHGRGLAIIATTVIVFGSLTIINKQTDRKQKTLLFVIYVIINIGIYLLNKIVKSVISYGFFGVNTGTLNNTTDNFLTKSFFQSIFRRDALKILYGLLGQSFYIVAASFGLVLVLFVALISRIRKKDKDQWDKRLIVLGIYTVSLIVFTIGMVILFFSNLYITEALIRSEYYLYGRYNEIAIGLIVFFALVFIAEKDENAMLSRWCYLLFLIIFILGGCFVVGKIFSSYNPVLSFSMVIGILPFAGTDICNNPSVFQYVKLMIVVTIIFVAIMELCRKHKMVIVSIALLGLFVFSSSYTFKQCVMPASREKYEAQVGVSGLNAQLKLVMGVDLNKAYVLQAELPKPRVLFSLSDYSVEYLEGMHADYSFLEKIEKDSIILSKVDEKLDYMFNDVFFLGQYDNYYVWVYGDKVRELTSANGLLSMSRASQAYVFDENSLYLTSNTFSNGNLALASGDTQFGPYCSMARGKYKVEIFGNNLSKGNFDGCSTSKGNDGFVISNMRKTDQYVSYYINIDEYINDMEFVCDNKSSTTLFINKLVITPMQLDMVTMEKEANNLYYRHRVYPVSDLYDGFRQHLQAKDGNTIISTRYVRIYGGGELNIKDVPIKEGYNVIKIKGKNISASNIQIRGVDSDNISFDLIEGGDSDSIYIALTSPKNITINIKNNDCKYVDFEQLEIADNIFWLQ